MDYVFDFGNVLIEWNPIRLVNEHFAKHLQPSDSPEAFTARWMNADWAAYDLGRINTREVAERMAPVLACEVAPLHAFIEKIPAVIPVMDESIAAMLSLCQRRDAGEEIRVFYLSNMPREFADVLEARFAWIAQFDGGIFSGREGLAKPDPAIYAALESRYGLMPDSTLFFDDSLPNVKAASARGWQTVRVLSANDVSSALRVAIRGVNQ